MSLKKSASTGIKWSSASQVARMAMQWITVVILARLLSPNDFGLVGIAMVVIGFIALFRDLGTSASIIQQKNLSESLLSSLFWVNAGFGLIATVFIFLLSPLVGLLYSQPEVTSLLRLLSITFFISGLGIIQQAFLERQLKFNRLARIEMSAAALGSIVGVVAAILESGAWSLVYQTIATTSANTLLLWIFCQWRPRAIFHFIEVKKISSFSLNLTGFNVINYFARNGDNLLIGYFLGTEALGFYNMAYRLMLYPLLNVSYVINRVVFPIYARIQDDNARFREAFLITTGAIALITFPLMIGMMVLREPLITVIFGSKWNPVIILVLILAPVGIMQSVMTTTGAIYQAKGRTDWLFRWGLGACSLYIISFVIGLKWGIEGVATAYAIMTTLLIYPCFAIPFRLIRLPVRRLAIVLWRPLFCTLIMMLSLYGAKAVLDFDISSWLALLAATAFGAIVYLSISWFVNQKQIKLVMEILGAKV